MKNLVLKSTLAAAALTLAASAMANPRTAILIGYSDVASIDNTQEKAAAEYFLTANPDGGVIAAGESSKITTGDYDCIWVHIDRLNIGKGNLPAEFSDKATISALQQFVENGGNLLLTKQATQLVSKIGRVPAAFDPNIYGDGDGVNGTDIWTIQAHIGLDNMTNDPSQYYDRSTHEIYTGLAIWPANSPEYGNYDSDTFPMEGTGNGSEMWREDHNCCWDLNAYTYTAEGKNRVEQFENETNSVVLGTWGHVKDYAVAGIVEFLPTEKTRATSTGRIIANGLAACEWAPRNGGNAYQANLEKLTDNCIKYLAKSNVSVIVNCIEEDLEAEKEYFNLQGVNVDADALVPGIYVVRQGNRTSKVIVK